jgi:cyclopropane fatty-acyl-phospholipid synthase-like methyltransferase
MSLSMIVMSIGVGLLITRTGRYKGFMVAGTLVMLAGFFLLTRMHYGSSQLRLTLAMIIVGLGVGSAMVYSGGYWPTGPNDSFDLEQAQLATCELVITKLGLAEAMRVLDVGWGTSVIRAARIFGVHAIGVTLSQKQAEGAALQRYAAHMRLHA